MANGEDGIKDAKTPQEAVEKWLAYVASMEKSGQKPKSIKDITGR